MVIPNVSDFVFLPFKSHGVGFPWVLVLLFLLGSHTPAWSEPVFHEEESWSLDLPAGWELTSSEPAAFYTAFADNTKTVAAQIFLTSKPGDMDPGVPNKRLREGLGARLASGEEASFVWQGRNAVLADIAWGGGQGQASYRGYLLTVSQGSGSLGLLVSCGATQWQAWHPVLLTVLDSLGLNQDDWSLPGPISALIALDQSLRPGDVHQILIEREALVLAGYQTAPEEFAIEAWERFYRVIYRSAIGDIQDFALEFRNQLVKNRVPAPQHAQALATYIQGFTYERLGEISDLRSPILALEQKIGDCDTRGLLFMIVLRAWGIPSIMMVSPLHQHSLVGIDQAGPGARFEHQGRSWLIAELTAPVALGMIEAKMSSSEDWIGMNVEFNPWN